MPPSKQGISVGGRSRGLEFRTTTTRGGGCGRASSRVLRRALFEERGSSAAQHPATKPLSLPPDAIRRREAAEARKAQRRRQDEGALSGAGASKYWWLEPAAGVVLDLWNKARNVQSVRTRNDLDNVLAEAKRTGRPIVAEFFAPACKACKALQPRLATIVRSHPDVLFVRINASENVRMVRALGVKKLPWFKLWSEDMDKPWSGSLTRHEMDALAERLKRCEGDGNRR